MRHLGPILQGSLRKTVYISAKNPTDQLAGVAPSCHPSGGWFVRTATRYQLPSAWLQTAAPHSRSQFCAGARSEDRASLQLKSHAPAQGGNAAGLVGAVIGEGKTCQRPMPGIPGGAWSVGPHAYTNFLLSFPLPTPLGSSVHDCTGHLLISLRSTTYHGMSCCHFYCSWKVTRKWRCIYAFQLHVTCHWVPDCVCGARTLLFDPRQ